MINKYLKELVENNNRIIIPDFGAFMVQSTPQGKQISFNDFLKFNDGLLVNQIIKAEKISKNDATNQIKEFIKSIDAAFARNEPFEIKEVGFLHKDANGNIKFDKELANKKSAAPQTDAKPTIELDEKKEIEKESAKTVEKKVEPKKEVKATEKPVTKTATPTPKVEAKPEIKKPEVDKPLIKPQGSTIPHAVTQPKPDIKAPEKTATHIGNKQEEPKKNKAKSTKIVLIVAAVVIILGGGGYSLYHFGIFDKPEPVVEVAPIPEPIIDTTPVIDTTIIIEEPKVIEEPAIDPNAKRYYIIAGSFKIATNADNYNQKLIDEGYNSEIIVRRNGFNTVSYKTLYNWNDALQEWRNMRNINEQTWILIK